jgi:hypothetical protein
MGEEDRDAVVERRAGVAGGRFESRRRAAPRNALIPAISAIFHNLVRPARARRGRLRTEAWRREFLEQYISRAIQLSIQAQPHLR